MPTRVARGSYRVMHALEDGRWRIQTGWEVVGLGTCLRCGERLPLGAHVVRASSGSGRGYACPACVPAHPGSLIRNPIARNARRRMLYHADRFVADCVLCVQEREAYEAHLDDTGQPREPCPHCGGSGYAPPTSSP